MLRLDAFWNDMIAGGILLIVLIVDGKIREAMAQALRYQKYRKFLEPDHPDTPKEPKQDTSGSAVDLASPQDLKEGRA